ncbi:MULTISPECIES: hypothetical protein [Mumia]|uniref:hypothetical protein n=1 Tax=Mumia TaxID=1546255 RepID=UPI0014210616|nr:hypothetical protein [Mumia sp. ZJ1417]QMW66975.1 hypothetical protein H4N58_03265 [Mumia sp. ZJ1417]
MARAHARDDGAPTLADGAVVRAYVVARLLGVRLLKLEATILLAPPPGPSALEQPVLGTALRGATPLAPVTAPARDGGLPEAQRLLAEARAALDTSR